MIVISKWITELGLWSVLVIIKKCSEVSWYLQIMDEKNSGRLKPSATSAFWKNVAEVSRTPFTDKVGQTFLSDQKYTVTRTDKSVCSTKLRKEKSSWN
jgi:hypothetical protein